MTGLRACLAVLALAACTAGEPIDTRSAHAPDGRGPRVVWDLGARPLPEVPLPNDVATAPDSTSATGVRVNASMIAPTGGERTLRQQFDELDGWGTFMPISVAFDDDLDVQNILSRQQDDDFRNDAIYVINLETGLPIPLDVGQGNYPQTVSRPQGYLPNDPRAGESNLIFPTRNEDVNGDGFLQVGEDSNFDGRLQRAAVFPAGSRPEDHLTAFWEPESRTLIVRPLIPLDERTRYAVVLTDRLRGANGAVRSPFDTIAHPAQLLWLHALETHLANRGLNDRLYGGLSWNDERAAGGRVAFAWTFITQTTVTAMLEVREGLYGRGRLAGLARTTPDFEVFPARGGADCPDRIENRFIIPAADIQRLVVDFAENLGFGGAQGRELIESYRWVDYAVVTRIRSPYLLGDPRSAEPDSRWHLDAVAAHPESVAADEVQVWMFIPRTRPDARPPFPVAMSAHGYGIGALQGFGFAGYFARFGLATVAANAPGHGFPIPAFRTAVRAYLRGHCLSGFGDAAVRGRALDLNGDGDEDNGASFLTSRVFHTRDMFRQTALDYMQLMRAMTAPSWSTPGRVDYNSDGRLDAPGDMNGDGIVDLGGQRDGADVPYFMWGESLGGITSMILGGLDPNIRAVAPISGGAGLTDVSLRSNVDGVVGAVLLPTLGPVIVALPASERPPRAGRTQTSCPANTFSLRWVVSDANRIGELEFACPTIGAGGMLEPGDDVVAYNLANDGRRCARIRTDGRLFLPIATDQGDPIRLRVFRGQAVNDYANCTPRVDAVERVAIDRFTVGEGDCDDTCGHIPPNARETSPVRAPGRAYARGRTLSSPVTGLGLRRQTAELRRFLQLSQAGIDAGDPANFAPLFFLRPRTSQAHPVLTMTTAGDDLVPVAAGNTFARAAGLLPFLTRRTGTPLDEYVAPTAITTRYGGRTPNGLLLDYFVIEGLARLERSPVAGHPRYLFDADDLDDGLQPFGENRLDPPLRLVRGARSIGSALFAVDTGANAAAIEDVWQPRVGEPLGAFANAYVQPEGVHTFYPSNPSDTWDSGAYLTNLVCRFFQTQGRDVVYYTQPRGHQCLADNTCSFMPP